MFPLIYAWINAWANNREGGDLRRHRAHYVTIMFDNGGRRDDLCRTDFRFAPSQWETSLQKRFSPSQREMSLQCNAVSHWLCANLEPCLCVLQIDLNSNSIRSSWAGTICSARIPISKLKNILSGAKNWKQNIIMKHTLDYVVWPIGYEISRIHTQTHRYMHVYIWLIDNKL